MSDEPALNDTGRTETTTRQFDAEGKLTSETVTVVHQRSLPAEDLPVGMYL